MACCDQHLLLLPYLHQGFSQDILAPSRTRKNFPNLLAHLFSVAHEFDAGEYVEAIEASKNMKN